MHSFSALDADEKVQFNAYWVTQITSHFVIRDLYLTGELPKAEFEIFENDIVCCLLSPGLREWWSQVGHSYLTWGEYLNPLIMKWDGVKQPYTETFPHLAER
jgi:hypothetical protein